MNDTSLRFLAYVWSNIIRHSWPVHLTLKPLKKDDSLFRRRYKAVLVGGDTYFLLLSCYVHHNSIEIIGAEAGIVDV